MKTYKQNSYKPGKLTINQTKEGETIELKIERIVNNKEPIKDGAPLIYTQRKDGVKSSMNIKTDRFMVAAEAADKIAKSYQARREERGLLREKEGAKIGEPEPVQGKTGTITDKPK